MTSRKTDFDKALRKAEAARKVAGATGPATNAGAAEKVQPRQPPKGASRLGDVEDDFGLPEVDSAEDLQQRRSLLECLGLIRSLARSTSGALGLQAVGASSVIASLIINRSPSVREEVCRTIETVSSAAAAAQAQGGEGEGYVGQEGTGASTALESVATDLLAGALFDKEHAVRITAARAIGAVFHPLHKVGSKRVLKALDSGDSMVRRAAVGALGSIHQMAHHKYFSRSLARTGHKANERQTEEAGDHGDGGLLGAVLNRLFVKDRGVRISSACAVLEMCSLSREEESLPAELRSKRQFMRDGCCWGAEGVSDMILARLRQAVDEGSVSTAPTLSPMHSPLVFNQMPSKKSSMSITRARVTKGSDRASCSAGKGTDVEKWRGGGVKEAEKGTTDYRSKHGASVKDVADGRSREDEYTEEDDVQLEGLRLLLYLIGK